MGDIEQMLCILAHPERWSDSFGAWLKELVWQNVKNIGKEKEFFFQILL